MRIECADFDFVVSRLHITACACRRLLELGPWREPSCPATVDEMPWYTTENRMRGGLQAVQLIAAECSVGCAAVLDP